MEVTRRCARSLGQRSYRFEWLVVEQSVCKSWFVLGQCLQQVACCWTERPLKGIMVCCVCIDIEKR
jgi:hypothetical protein